MTEEWDSLKQGYRDIKAPSHLATRIRAEVADDPLRTRSWILAGATVAAVFIVAWFAPNIGEQPVTPAARTSKPSLSAITALKPSAPVGTSVSMSHLKTVKKPKLPTKPRLNATKPQSNLKLESDLLEESHNVLS